MGGGGPRWNIEEGLSETLKMCQREEVWFKMPKIRVKCLSPLTKTI